MKRLATATLLVGLLCMNPVLVPKPLGETFKIGELFKMVRNPLP